MKGKELIVSFCFSLINPPIINVLPSRIASSVERTSSLMTGDSIPRISFSTASEMICSRDIEINPPLVTCGVTVKMMPVSSYC